MGIEDGAEIRNDPDSEGDRGHELLERIRSGQERDIQKEGLEGEVGELRSNPGEKNNGPKEESTKTPQNTSEKRLYVYNPSSNRKTVSIIPNTFIVEDPVSSPVDRSFITVEDLSDPTEEYSRTISQLDYTYKVDDYGNVLSLQGRNSEDTVRVFGRRIDIGASRNAILVVDRQEKKGWVMYEANRNYQGGSGVNAVEYTGDIQIPLDLSTSEEEELSDRVLRGAYRYLPLENDFSLFPHDLGEEVSARHGKIGRIIGFANEAISLFHPSFLLARLQKYQLREAVIAQGFEQEELHDGNISIAVWDKKPGLFPYALPTVAFKWQERNGKRFIVPAVRWTTAELTEFSAR